MVDRRDLVAHEVRDRENAQHDERTGPAQVVEGLGEVDEVEALRERGAEQRQPGVESGGRRQAKGRAHAGEIHGGSVGAHADGLRSAHGESLG